MNSEWNNKALCNYFGEEPLFICNGRSKASNNLLALATSNFKLLSIFFNIQIYAQMKMKAKSNSVT
jgi:hypothetical protein